MSESDSSEFNPSVPNFSNIHALIIGINKYISSAHENLGGCVSDAKAIRNLLTDRFGVPEANIECLFDEQATRKGILGAFRKHLIQNEKIQPGDPILVYFSGHGDRLEAPDGWHNEWHTTNEGQIRMTELILPHDASCWDEVSNVDPNISSSDSQPGTNLNGDATTKGPRYDPNKHYKHGIPDRTLAALIHQLSKAKGDNITVILDSCHSGSGTRGQCRARFSHDPDAPPIPSNIDEEDHGHFPTQGPLSQVGSITATKEDFGKFKAPSQAPSLATHVLLAACKNDEVAQELPDKNEVDEEGEPRYRGLFTMALIAELECCDPATTSYSALTRGVQKRVSTMFTSGGPSTQVRIQSPQCEGRKQDRLLFRTQFAFTKGMIQLDRDRPPRKFRIKAGSASGIQIGTQLGVYSNNMSDGSPPVAQLEVTGVTDTEAWLSIKAADRSFEIPQNAYVMVTKYTGHSVRIRVDDQLKTASTWQEVFAKLQSQPIDIVWSKPDEPSDLVLKPKGEDVVLLRSDPSIIQLQPRDIELQYRLGASELARKLSSIAHFHFHLQRRNPNSPLHGKVGMKLIELKAKPGRTWMSRDYVPIKDDPEDLFDDNLSKDSVIVQLQAAPDKRYGLQLTNSSNWPLFAWVVYFDLEDYSITFLYNPPARNANPPLSTNGKELAVGYGDTGVEPLRVENSGYSKTESGVFMLFVSQKWVDIAHMEQDSIFSQMSPDKGGRADDGRPVNPDSNVWDVFVVAVNIK
ncbi:hypothetical protein FRC12_013314 [Ceratobasidium sp. 428]|nr:hypothetical protein FRC12_013314 [Ceratobasidium sp. 428]